MAVQHIRVNDDKLADMAVIAIANSLKRRVGSIPHTSSAGDNGWWTDRHNPDPNDRYHIRHYLVPSADIQMNGQGLIVNINYDIRCVYCEWSEDS